MADMPTRPVPPEEMIEDTSIRFEPAADLLEWARSSFIDETADLVNEDHAHLRFASIGVLWTNVPNGRNGRRIIGQCEMGLPPGGQVVARSDRASTAAVVRRRASLPAHLRCSLRVDMLGR
ncbi:putative metallopeptidase [Rhizobium gallicum]|uniref:putative metallopeptidase n=1 Tax=Rhizobium gallicum TaxID=56730 RepID=UPI0023BB0A44|nr:putative metallopeptidase [Rhizobium gallicum]